MKTIRFEGWALSFQNDLSGDARLILRETAEDEMHVVFPARLLVEFLLTDRGTMPANTSGADDLQKAFDSFQSEAADLREFLSGAADELRAALDLSSELPDLRAIADELSKVKSELVVKLADLKAPDQDFVALRDDLDGLRKRFESSVEANARLQQLLASETAARLDLQERLDRVRAENAWLLAARDRAKVERFVERQAARGMGADEFVAAAQGAMERVPSLRELELNSMRDKMKELDEAARRRSVVPRNADGYPRPMDHARERVLIVALLHKRGYPMAAGDIEAGRHDPRPRGVRPERELAVQYLRQMSLDNAASAVERGDHLQ